MKKKKQKRDYFVSCIVAAAGESRRMGENVNKLFLEIGGAPVIAHTLLALQNSGFIDEIIVAAKEEDMLDISDIAADFEIDKLKAIVKGGAVRAESVKAAIAELSEDCDLIAVHDGARPLVDEETIAEAVSAGFAFGAAACGVRPKATIKREDENGFIAETVDRSELFEIQTPQVFSKALFLNAYDADEDALRAVTDDCALVEKLGTKIKITPGSYRNIKITTVEDIAVAEGLLSSEEW